jgi:hypothetical protein
VRDDVSGGKTIRSISHARATLQLTPLIPRLRTPCVSLFYVIDICSTRVSGTHTGVACVIAFCRSTLGLALAAVSPH